MDDDILYHYTSVDTLALILKNQTFRLNNLTDMDDLEEGNSVDYEKIGRFIFSSSWTNSSEESIPLWNLYTPDMRGIRIGMPKDFFSPNDGYKNIRKDCEANGVTFVDEQIKLIEVIYTDDDNFLCPTIFKEIKENEIPFKFELDRVCTYKRNVWKFQNEWRYCAKILPFTINEFYSMIEDEDKGKDKISNALRDLNFKIFPYIDIPIESEMLSKMTIMLGPKMSYANKFLVESLVEKYNPNIKIEDSKLKIK
ncbi:DUF2971 domain-containing protein [Lysinibacillus fusiformis]|uniref:DUF2971 domain-containing protein n=1 Tax=Lysinibacillus fusiformis TaxID=28031 RepID=UPI003AABD619